MHSFDALVILAGGHPWALMDLADLAHNTGHGLYIASLAGAWSAVVAGFGGTRHLDDGGLAFALRLPEALARITFRLRWRGRRLQVDITSGKAKYRLLEGAGLELRHHGQPITLTVDSPEVQPIPPTEHLMQPVGREPLARSPARRRDQRPDVGQQPGIIAVEGRAPDGQRNEL